MLYMFKQHFTEEQNRIRQFLIVAIFEIEKQMKVKKFDAIDNAIKNDVKLGDIPASKTISFATLGEYSVLDQLLKQSKEFIQPSKLFTADFSQIHTMFDSAKKNLPQSDTKSVLDNLLAVARKTEENFKNEASAGYKSPGKK